MGAYTGTRPFDVGLSADGGTLAVSGYANDRRFALIVLDVPSGRVIARWESDTYIGFQLATNGTRIARTANGGRDTVVTDLPSDTAVTTLVGFAGPYSAYDFLLSPDGSRYAVFGNVAGDRSKTTISDGVREMVVEGRPQVWLDDHRLVLESRMWAQPGREVFSGSRIYDVADAAETPTSLPAGIMEVAGTDRVLSKSEATIYDVGTGARTWSAAAPADEGRPSGAVIAGSKVVFSTETSLHVQRP
jgi:hypothetical protein